MCLIYTNNKFILIKKKLKYLVEVTLETDGSFTISPKLALLLTQSGIYENTPIFDYLNDYFSFIEIDEDQNIFKSENIQNLDDKNNISLIVDENNLNKYSDVDGVKNEFEDYDCETFEEDDDENNDFEDENEYDEFENEIVKDNNNLDKNFSEIDEVNEENIEDKEDEFEVKSKSFLVSFLFVFYKQNGKTKIYVLNPFYNTLVNLTLKYNLLDFFIKNKRNLYFQNIKNKEKKMKTFYEYYWNYILKWRIFISKQKKKRFSYFYFKKKKNLHEDYFYLIRRKKKRFKMKGASKKVNYKRFLRFIFIFKAKKWLDYFIFFKLIILNSYYFSDDYSYLKLKLNLYTFSSFAAFYKSWFIKKLRRRFFFKRKYGRNRLGELMLIIRPIILKKKKK